MARIIDVDTEAFAPTYQSTYKAPAESARDANLRRIGAKMQLTGQALPLVGAGASLLDQYLITPVQKYQKGVREEEYKGAKAGEELFEPLTQEIAKNRMEAVAPAVVAAPAAPAAEAAPVKQEAAPSPEALRQKLAEVKARQSYKAPARMVPGAAPIYGAPEFAVPERYKEDYEYAKAMAKRLGTSEEDLPSIPEAEGEKKFNETEAAQTVERSAERLKPTAQPFSAEELKRYGFDERGTYLPHPVPKGQLPAVTPAKPISMPRPEAEPSFAGTEVQAGTTATAETAKAAAAPAAPAAPKTLATATDDELADAGRKLKRLVEQNPNDPEYARRLRQVELEQRHREEKIEFEDWAAIARGADTPEEQQRALELAKRVRMPWRGSFQDILKTPFERAREEAIGTREEKGLFPEMGRPLSQYDIALKKAQTAYAEAKAQGQTDRQARDRAQAVLATATAGLRTAQEEEVRTMTPFKAGKMGEQIQQIHAQEQKLNAETDRIRTLLPGQKQKLEDESAKLKALASKARASARRGGAGLSGDELKWVKELNDRRKEMVDQATKIQMESESHYGQVELAAERAKFVAERAALDVSRLGEESPLNDAETNRKIAQAKAEAEAAKTAVASAEAARRRAEQEVINARSHKADALRAGDAEKANADYLTEMAMKKRGYELPSRSGKPETKEKPAEGGGLGGILGGLFGGGTKPASAPATKPVKKGGKVDDFFK